MMNLIPPQGERVVRREYILRVATTYAALLGGVALVLATLCVPTYILVDAQINAFKTGAGDVTDTESLAHAEAEIKQVKEILAQLRSQKEPRYASDVLEHVETLAPDGITFKTFTLGYAKDTIETVTLIGVATTRETLIQYKKGLETSDTFATAEVPIADLAKDTNLPFTMTITLTPQ